MKKATRLTVLLALFTLVFCVSAMAADGDPTVSGIYDINSALTVTAQTADQTAVTPATVGSCTNFCADAVRLSVNYEAAEEGKFYLLVVTNRDVTGGMPTTSDILYIDQQTATADGVSFNAYPSSLGSGEYYLFLSSNATEGFGKDGLEKVGCFKFYQPYRLGDVDDDTNITANDALWALMMSVDKTLPGKTGWTETQRLSADVDGITGVSANDALWILEASVDKRVLN